MTLRCKLKKVKKVKGEIIITLKCPGRMNTPQEKKEYIQSLKETNIQIN